MDPIYTQLHFNVACAASMVIGFFSAILAHRWRTRRPRT